MRCWARFTTECLLMYREEILVGSGSKNHTDNLVLCPVTQWVMSEELKPNEVSGLVNSPRTARRNAFVGVARLKTRSLKFVICIRSSSAAGKADKLIPAAGEPLKVV